MGARLVAFDLDGTLVDSRQDIAQAANELIVGCGGHPLPQAAIVGMVGEGARLLVERAFAAAGLREPSDAHLVEFQAIYRRHLVDTTTPYGGVPELLRTLASAQFTLAVVTNKPTQLARELLQHFDLLGVFRAVVGGDGPYPRKPSPDSMLDVMRGADADGASTWLVGDSHVDLRTARAVGVPFCLARYGFGAEQMPDGLVSPEDAILDRPLDLLATLGVA